MATALSSVERVRIEEAVRRGERVDEIAACLGRHRSTVYRERVRGRRVAVSRPGDGDQYPANLERRELGRVCAETIYQVVYANNSRSDFPPKS